MGKICPQCEKEGEFYKDSHSKDGLSTYCKTCHRSKMNARYAEIAGQPDVVARMKRNTAKWNAENKEYKAATNAKRNRENRERCLAHYGGKCECCGESRYEFLAIDHADGNGAKHRKKDNSAVRIAVWLIKNNFPDGFRVLCHNCNCAIGFYGYCPHQLNPETSQQSH